MKILFPCKIYLGNSCHVRLSSNLVHFDDRFLQKMIENDLLRFVFVLRGEN